MKSQHCYVFPVPRDPPMTVRLTSVLYGWPLNTYFQVFMSSVMKMWFNGCVFQHFQEHCLWIFWGHISLMKLYVHYCMKYTPEHGVTFCICNCSLDLVQSFWHNLSVGRDGLDIKIHFGSMELWASYEKETFQFYNYNPAAESYFYNQ